MAIKPIKFTKEPTTKQMLQMALNLREKFNGCHACVDFQADAYSQVENPAIKFNLYVAGIGHEYGLKTYIDLINCYNRFMNRT